MFSRGSINKIETKSITYFVRGFVASFLIFLTSSTSFFFIALAAFVALARAGRAAYSSLLHISFSFTQKSAYA
jgi:hypothetical protein